MDSRRRAGQRTFLDGVIAFLVGVGVIQLAFQTFLLLALPFVEVGPLKPLVRTAPALLVVSAIGGLLALACWGLGRTAGKGKTSLAAIYLLGGMAAAILLGDLLAWPHSRREDVRLALALLGIAAGGLLFHWITGRDKTDGDTTRNR